LSLVINIEQPKFHSGFKWIKILHLKKREKYFLNKFIILIFKLLLLLLLF
jgi:hypothetical protein